MKAELNFMAVKNGSAKACFLGQRRARQIMAGTGIQLVGGIGTG